MVRNIVLMKLKTDYDSAALETLCQRLRELHCPGTLAYTVGTDAGLREGSWTVGIVADFTDVDAYRNYDNDSEHNRIRAELAPMIEEIARCQFVL